MILQFSVSELASLGRYLVPLKGGQVRFLSGGLIQAVSEMSLTEAQKAICELKPMGFTDLVDFEAKFFKENF